MWGMWCGVCVVWGCGVGVWCGVWCESVMWGMWCEGVVWGCVCVEVCGVGV